jgi:hypothetical protein
LQASDDEVGDEVGVLGDRFGAARVAWVEVARERGQREGCGDGEPQLVERVGEGWVGRGLDLGGERL